MDSSSSIDDKIQQLVADHDGLRRLKPRVYDNFDALNNELTETQTLILSFERYQQDLQSSIASHNEAIKRLQKDLGQYRTKM